MPTAGNISDRIGQQLQDAFDPNLVSNNPIAEQAKGAVESVAGLGRTAIDYSPTRAMVDFDLPAHDHATYTYWCAEDRGLELHTYSPETMTSGRDPIWPAALTDYTLLT